MLAFVAVVALLNGLIHLYLWKRLVRDTTRPGRWRRAGGVLAVLLALLVPATVMSTRAGVAWLAWPGYLWLAVLFYLLIVLLLLELPLLVARWLVRRGAARTGADPDSAAPPAPTPTPALVRASGQPGAGDVPVRQPVSVVDGPGSPPRPREAPSRPELSRAVASGHTPAGGPSARPDHDPGRRLLLARGAATVAGLAAVGVTGYGVRTAFSAPRLDRVRIPLAKLPPRMDGLRIATVSDIHLGPLAGRAHTERIVEMINRLDADLVAVVGDLVDGTVAEMGSAAAPLRDLRSRYGSYFVTGNHEYYSGAEEWVSEVDRLGLRVLLNERREIVTPGGVIDLAGVNDPSARTSGATGRDAGRPTSPLHGPDFEAALGGRDTSRPVVLLAHQPVVVHEAARHGVDLQLSGHTHGGQMVPFNYVVGAVQPVVSGYAKFGGTQIYVTNGAGFWGPPVRVGVSPQISLVELRAP